MIWDQSWGSIPFYWREDCGCAAASILWKDLEEEKCRPHLKLAKPESVLNKVFRGPVFRLKFGKLCPFATAIPNHLPAALEAFQNTHKNYDAPYIPCNKNRELHLHLIKSSERNIRWFWIHFCSLRSLCFKSRADSEMGSQLTGGLKGRNRETMAETSYNSLMFMYQLLNVWKSYSSSYTWEYFPLLGL